MQGIRSNQQKLLFCFEILSLFPIIVLGYYFISHYCFVSMIFFPIIVLKYYFISYYNHIMSMV